MPKLSPHLHRLSLGLLAILPFTVAPAWAVSSWDGKAPAEYILNADVDRPDAKYHKGDTVTFTLKLEHNNQPATTETVDYVITKDGYLPPSKEPISKGTVNLVDGKATVTATLDEPGFLLCTATFKKDKTVFTAPVAAAIDPQEIKPSMPVPDDFDAFWAEKLKQLAAVPINATLTPIPALPDRPNAEMFEMQADCVGKPVTGYYARPVGAKPKSCPALLMVPGAGVLSCAPINAARWGDKGFLTLDVNAHGIPNGKPKEFYAELAAGELKDYRTHGRESRDTYYFLGMYLRVVRALDFLASQPEWDGHTLFIEGVSQGGAQAIAGAALDPRVSFLLAGFPAMSDHSGMVANRIAGWPKMVAVGPDGKPDPASLETSRYFDSVNFASRVKAPTYYYLGYIDIVTPPTGAYAAYNAIPGKKELVEDPIHGHGRDNPEFWSTVSKVTLEQAKAQGATPSVPVAN